MLAYVFFGLSSSVSDRGYRNWINFALYANDGPIQWRFPLAFQLVFPLIVLSSSPWIPDSPRWLLIRDRHEEAIACLARLRGRGAASDDIEVLDEYRSIEEALVAERRCTVSWKDVLLFRDRTQNMRRILLGCGTQLMQQVSLRRFDGWSGQLLTTS